MGIPSMYPQNYRGSPFVNSWFRFITQAWCWCIPPYNFLASATLYLHLPSKKKHHPPHHPPSIHWSSSDTIIGNITSNITTDIHENRSFTILRFLRDVSKMECLYDYRLWKKYYIGDSNISESIAMCCCTSYDQQKMFCTLCLETIVHITQYWS